MVLPTNKKQTAKVAAGCIRTLLLTIHKTPADQSIARYLLPLLIAFVTNKSTEDPEAARSLVAHALTSFVTTLASSQKGVAMAVIIPTLLARANTEGEEVYKETSARLLDLAGSDQGSFRGVVAGLSEAQKGFLEGVVQKGRERRDVGKVGVEEEGREPSIALRMDFGG